ncbi:hypothetical protein A2Y85_06620 [candidate division WOR-3 bacterium RBG_13_43_14]|uniref:Uncharacterized protein n=1 Tax=candidate division WOR-3 bacterium RBG_13_43_14 TaxID=1802590 RepID=A0A1F4UFY3_UNCW3|nr:MAG: hypothetical protein A2Y85_06620 [candidate division WOR-3 bacterium RBG_13_43_14]
MRKMLYLILAMMIIGSISNATPLLWRGPQTIGKGKPIFMAEFTYCTIARSYNWTDEEWTDIPDQNQTEVIGAHFMLGYAPIHKLELLAHIPVMMKTRDTLDALGIQDVWFKTRYNFVGSKTQPWLTGVLGARFPTANENDNPPLDDRTLDFMGGLLFQYNMNPLVFHVKGGYFYNGKTDADLDLGDEIEGNFKVDYIFNKQITAFIAFTYIHTLQSSDSTGTSITNSEKQNLTVCPGIVYKTDFGLSIRPKFLYPLEMVNKGGTSFAWKIGLDFWFVPK